MPAPSPISSGRFASVGVIVLTVAVFASGVVGVTWQLRAGLREQTLNREARVLAAVTSMQLTNSAEDFGLPLDQVPGGLFFAVLKTTKLAGVSGVRVFDADRRLSDTWLLPAQSEPPAEDLWHALEAGHPQARLVSRRRDAAILEQALGPGADSGVEAWVPLRPVGATAMQGAAQFWLDGKELAADFAAHDRRLWTQAAIVGLTGSLVIAVALGWALRRLARANQSLRVRSEDLQRANRELVLAAKTSALGTVTAHLMHELKNPLAGLETLVAGSGTRVGEAGGDELAAATALTRRLRGIVNDVIGVLRDEHAGADFELTPGEVAELVLPKVQPEATARSVRLEVDAPGKRTLAGRRANLTGLILRNLLQNALEASPAGGRVRLTANDLPDGAVEFIIEDEAGGLPAAVRERLFEPCVSSKSGGSGLGLALSHRLAQQADARLELAKSDATGTRFRLLLPVS